ncbi:MAG: chorismate--pyruvate lyase [Candidatus Endobugula sp.]|jgi:chorismate--pyruvate lyase
MCHVVATDNDLVSLLLTSATMAKSVTFSSIGFAILSSFTLNSHYPHNQSAGSTDGIDRNQLLAINQEPISRMPVSKEPRWKTVSQQRHGIDSHYLHWLTDEGSLTKKLVQKANGDFRVSVLCQSIRPVLPSEQHVLLIPHRQWAMIREVVLYGKNVPWVYARTAIPLSTLKGSLRRLHYLGNQPLGEQLFADPSMQRGKLQIAQFLPSHIPLVAQEITKKFQQSTWGRRSVFCLSSQPMLVSEVFLPSLIYS